MKAAGAAQLRDIPSDSCAASSSNDDFVSSDRYYLALLKFSVVMIQRFFLYL